MHTTCIVLHVVQRSAVTVDPAIRLIVGTPPVSVRIWILFMYVSLNDVRFIHSHDQLHAIKTHKWVISPRGYRLHQ